MGASLQNMLTINQTLEFVEIECKYYMTVISSTYLSFLTTGLSHNTSLRELSIFIPLSDTNTNNEQIRTFFNVISQKNHLTELQQDFIVAQSYLYDNIKRASLFYEQGLPLVTNMLVLHTTIRLLRIKYSYITVYSSPPVNWIELIQHFLQTIFLQPSLEYIEIGYSNLLKDTYRAQEKSLIDHHKKTISTKTTIINRVYSFLIVQLSWLRFCVK